MIIYKYHIPMGGPQEIEIPDGGKVLSVHSQRGSICIWVLLDESETDLQTRTFEIIGTGHPLTIEKGFKRQFIGTVLDEPFVWHVFERVYNV